MARAMSKAPILVTGAAGFIGMSLTRVLLARGERVIGVDNFNDYYDVRLKERRAALLAAEGGDAFELLRVDFADDDAFDAAIATKSFDRIVHLGAQAGVRYSIENPRAYIRANVAGHLNLLEVARARGTAHMVYASSSSVYGGDATLPFRVEERADHPLSLYAATKRADELMSDTYAHLYQTPLTGLRFFTVYGPWGRPDMAMWLFTSAILEGRPIDVFNGGDMRRDFTYIDDIVAGVIACLDNPPKGTRPHAVYNIGNSRSEALEHMIALVEQACGKQAIRRNKPMQPGDIKETFADLSAIERDLGFRPTTPIDIGVPRFVEWYRDYHSL
jgi:UDP-glucuronate 4-epimerase